MVVATMRIKVDPNWPHLLSHVSIHLGTRICSTFAALVYDSFDWRRPRIHHREVHRFPRVLVGYGVDWNGYRHFTRHKQETSGAVDQRCSLDFLESL